ncbi:TPA: hypothetical protein I7264_03215 [Vibrio parahaemolyticus]|nr:hypothetical protein [Vibrio parahaemolyticus]HAS6300013.1 hypothetical protein [Vibrio vulnificus]MDG2604268.1 hypothetical protein [Vibrio parahaemolyticus]HAS6394554.1 hypothetical protein [Vibrio vulnificus]HAS6610675.1 hypothetical protein [Vibrio parahaemolyticus]
MTKISKEVLGWNGKSAADIEQIYIEHHHEVDFSSALVELCLDEALSVGGTWLVKHHLECGGRFSNQEEQKIVTRLPSYQHWESKLHILQVISYLKISDQTRKILEPFLRHGLSDTNKFIKAWCFNGLYELATQYPELQNEVGELLNLALVNEPASVKARVRKLIKKGF